MTNEVIIAIVSAVAGGIVTLLTTLALDRRKEKREDRLEAKKNCSVRCFKHARRCRLLISKTISPALVMVSNKNATLNSLLRTLTM